MLLLVLELALALVRANGRLELCESLPWLVRVELVRIQGRPLVHLFHFHFHFLFRLLARFCESDSANRWLMILITRLSSQILSGSQEQSF